MRALRKTKRCLNCDAPLDEVYNYCPICGQQNDDKNVSFQELSRDLFENFFSFDSRLAHTFFPFFFRPGELTRKYNDGKRFTYANPIRLYIIVSVFYFFVLNVIVGDATRELGRELNGNPEVDSLQTAIINELDSSNVEIRTAGVPIQVSDEGDSTELWPMSNKQWRLFLQLSEDEKISEEAFLDSLHMENRHAFTQYTVKQMIRVYRTDKEHLTSKFVQNLSLMMFIMIPVFALLLKLLYIRRKTLYINHLIHTIHIHTFAFFVYGFTIAALYWMIDNDNLEGWLTFGSVVIVSTYAYLSFKNVYGQGWFKTLVKFWLTGLIYFNVMCFGLLLEMFLSFLVF